MNHFHAMGRITKDLELKTSQSGKSFLRFNVAVQRKYKNSEGKYDSDFLPCLAMDKTAEFISKYFKKGSMIGVSGHIQTGSYTNKDGKKTFSIDLFVEEADFAGDKGSGNNTSGNSNTNKQSSQPTIDNNAGFDVNSGFEDASDMDLPFN